MTYRFCGGGDDGRRFLSRRHLSTSSSASAVVVIVDATTSAASAAISTAAVVAASAAVATAATVGGTVSDEGPVLGGEGTVIDERLSTVRGQMWRQNFGRERFSATAAADEVLPIVVVALRRVDLRDDDLALDLHYSHVVRLVCADDVVGTDALIAGVQNLVLVVSTLRLVLVSSADDAVARTATG